MNQTQHVPFAKQNKTQQTTKWYANKEIIHIIYWMKMERTGKKQLQYTRTIKKTEQSNWKREMKGKQI